MASKGKSKHTGKRRGRPPKPKLEVQQETARKRYLLAGITKLRELIGEERVTLLVRSDVDVREKEWAKLLADKDPKVIDAAATVLTGLDLDPDEFAKEGSGKLLRSKETEL